MVNKASKKKKIINMKRDLEFLYEMGCLRFVQRTWKRFLNADFQNLSEHTLRVCWIAIVLAKYEKVKNLEKILKLALVHDIVESRSVDVDYLSRQYVKREEEKAILDMLDKTVLEDEFISLWKEYEEKKIIEAKIVKDADLIDVDLELKEQGERGHTLGENWKEMRHHVSKEKYYTKGAKKIWKAIQTSNPHDWHLHGNNRYNSGDWKK